MQIIDLETAKIKIYARNGRAYMSVGDYRDMPIKLYTLGDKIKKIVRYNHLDIRSKILIYAHENEEFYSLEVANYFGYCRIYIREILKEFFLDDILTRRKNGGQRYIYKLKEENNVKGKEKTTI